MIWALFARDASSSRFLSKRKEFTAPDGRRWQVEVRLPSASNAMLVFHHPVSAGGNRYAWYNSAAPESRDVKARLEAQQVIDSLTDADLARLFRRSMPISSQVPRLEPAVGTRSGPYLALEAAEDDVVST